MSGKQCSLGYEVKDASSHIVVPLIQHILKYIRNFKLMTIEHQYYKIQVCLMNTGHHAMFPIHEAIFNYKLACVM